MKIETDLDHIARLAQVREEENWAFRCFLKQSDIPSSKIDSQVHELFKHVSSQIDCTLCANCCKTISPVLSAPDIRRLAKHLGLRAAEFADTYLHAEPEGEGPTFKAKTCPFLRNNLCTVYQHRPTDCRSFPHLQKRGFVFRMSQAFSNCSLCPIVFNVYEELKRRMSERNKNMLPNQAL